MFPALRFAILVRTFARVGNAGWLACGGIRGREWVGGGAEVSARAQRGIRFWNMKTDLGLVLLPVKGIWAMGSQSRLRMHWMRLFGS